MFPLQHSKTLGGLDVRLEASQASADVLAAGPSARVDHSTSARSGCKS